MGQVSVLPIVDTRICEYCGKSFGVNRKQRTRNKRFCDKSCATSFNQKSNIKNDFNCLVCGTGFKSPIKKGSGRRKKFCSPECKRIYKRTRGICEFCGNEFVAYGTAKEKRYCSRLCRSKANPIPMTDLVCSWCSVSFQRETSQALRTDADPFRNVYCSHECFSTATSGENSARFLGNRKAYRGSSWKEKRSVVLEESEGLCYFCDKEIVGKNACVDHIVPFRLFKDFAESKELANESVNLWVLCRSCHAKKTMIEVGVLYSVGFERFVDRVSQLTAKEISDQMWAAHKHWTSLVTLKSELSLDKPTPEVVQ